MQTASERPKRTSWLRWHPSRKTEGHGWTSPRSSPLDRLRARFDALPLDRAPLRRAGVLTALLVVLLVAGKMLSPRPTTAAERHDVRPATEEVSAPPSAWTGGRVLAILFLLAGGGVAYGLHRRSPARASATGSTLEVLETHPLGPGQSLRLVACGDEVMLLSVTAEGAALLRHWPRAALASPTAASAPAPAAPSISFADALAERATDPETASPTAPGSLDPLEKTEAIQRKGTMHGALPAHAAEPEAAPPAEAVSTTIELATTERETAKTGTTEHARGALYPARVPRQFSVR